MSEAQRWCRAVNSHLLKNTSSANGRNTRMDFSDRQKTIWADFLRRRNEYFGDQLLLRRRSRIVGVVFDAVVVARWNFLLRDNLKNAATRFRQVGIGSRQNKTAVLTAFEFFIFQVRRQILRFRGKRNTGAIDLWADLEQARIANNLIVFQNSWNYLMQVLPRLRCIVLERSNLLDKNVVSFRPGHNVGLFREVH